MAKLKYRKTKDAARVVQRYAEEVEDGDQFVTDVAMLVREVQDETELSLMRGEVRHLGEKHMLLSSIYSAVSLTSRPVQREASYAIITDALDRYLDITVPKVIPKRGRRKLLIRD